MFTVHSIEYGPHSPMGSMLADTLAPLLAQVLQRGHGPRLGYIQATRVLPMLQGDSWLVPVIWAERTGAHVQVLLDTRCGGGDIQLLTVPIGTTASQVLPFHFQSQGWAISANGIGSASFRRPLESGDVLQLSRPGKPVPGFHFGHAVNLMPQLRVLTLPISLIDARPVPQQLTSAQSRSNVDIMHTELTRHINARIHLMGSADLGLMPVTVMSMHHGPILLYLPGPEPTLEHAQIVLNSIPEFPSGLQVYETDAFLGEVGVFVTAEPDAGTVTALVASTVGFGLDNLIVLPLLPTQQQLGAAVYLDPFYVAEPFRQPRNGHYIRRTRISLPGDGVALAQVTQRSAPDRQQRTCNRAQQLGLDWGPCRHAKVEPRSEVKPPTKGVQAARSTQDRAPDTRSIPTPLGRRSIPVSRQAGKSKICLEQVIPREDGPRKELRLGASADMFAAVYSDFTLANLCTTRPGQQRLPSHVTRCLRTLPETTGQGISAMQLYIDGSYFPQTAESSAKAGWAICVFTLEQDVWRFAGYIAVAAPVEGSASTLGQAVSSSFEPELAAIAYAQAFCIGINVPALILYDNQAAAAVGFAEAATAEPNAIADVCVAQMHLLRKLGREPLKLHIKSHSQHPLNDLADQLAKSAASAEQPVGLSQGLHEAVQEGVLEWLWAACNLHSDLPWIGENGKLEDLPVVPPARALDACVALEPKGGAQKVTFDLSIVTYNCLSLQALHHREHLDKEFHRLGLHVVGLQETRIDARPRSDSQNFFVLGSPAEAGQLGVQLWLAKRIPIARTNKGPIFWEGDSLSVIAATPRILVATARAAAQTFGFIVAHSPTSKAPKDVRQQWWKDFRLALQRLPPRAVPFVLIDANAQFEWSPEPPVADRAMDHNARELATTLAEFQLLASPNASKQGARRVTWIGPAQLACCLDYVACAQGFGPAIGEIHVFSDFEGLADHDHFPLRVQFRWTVAAKATARSLRLDRQAMRTSEGRRVIRRIFDSAPRIPWSCDVDTHLGLVNQYLNHALRQAFPLAAAKPRNYVISEQTWMHIRNRRALKRRLFQCKQAVRGDILGHCFAVWRGRACAPVPIRFRRQHEALLVRQLFDLSKLVQSQGAGGKV